MRRWPLGPIVLTTVVLTLCAIVEVTTYSPAVLAEEPAAAKAPDASFIHPGFAAAVIVHPQRLLNSPLLSVVPKEELEEKLKQISEQSHIDPRKVDEIMFLVGPPAPDGDQGLPMTPGIVLRFREAPDQQAVAAKFMKSPVAAEFEGKKYFRSGDRMPEGLYFADERTVLYAPEKSLQKMMTAGKGTGPLADLVRQANGDHDVLAVATMEPVKEMAKAAAQEAKGQLPPQLKVLASIPEHLKSASANIDLSAEHLIKLSMRGNDEDGANSLQSYALVARDFIKSAVAATKVDVQHSLPAESAPAILKMVDDLLAGISIKQDGLDVTLAVKTPPGWQDLPKTLAPLVAKAREQAKAAVRMNTLRMFALAMMNMESANGSPVKPAIMSKDGKPLLSWRVAVLPFLEQQALYEQFHQDEPWDSEHNRKLVEKMPPIFGANKQGKTCYMLFSGPGTVFGSGKNPAQLSASQKIMIVEAGEDKAVEWTKPEDLSLNPENPVAALGTLPLNRFLAAFFDGSVRMLDAKLDKASLKAMIDDQPPSDKPSGEAPAPK